jgi:predicted nuclease of predicted toxin-antitoxin system
MNFVADESCAGPVIRALREAGHDVVAIAEIAKGATDEEVLRRALTENRVLVTEDHDFGNMVYAHGRSSAGVILLRFPSRVRQAKPATVVEAVAKLWPTTPKCIRRGGARSSADKRKTGNLTFRTKREWRAQGDDFRTFLSELVSALPQSRIAASR